MKNRILRLASIILAMAALFTGLSIPALAATTAPITISAVPAYIALTVSPDTWTLNNIVGDGVTPKGLIAPNTIYYSNPLGDATAPAGATVVTGECLFEITNTSTLTTDVFVNIPAFTGGSAAMANKDTDGTNSATEFGAFSWYNGMTYANKVVAKSTGSAALKEDLAPTTNLKFGVEIKTRSNAWTGGTASTSVMVVSLAAA
jgi:hypothetical protein